MWSEVISSQFTKLAFSSFLRFCKWKVYTWLECVTKNVGTIHSKQSMKIILVLVPAPCTQFEHQCNPAMVPPSAHLRWPELLCVLFQLDHSIPRKENILPKYRSEIYYAGLIRQRRNMWQRTALLQDFIRNGSLNPHNSMEYLRGSVDTEANFQDFHLRI